MAKPEFDKPSCTIVYVASYPINPPPSFHHTCPTEIELLGEHGTALPPNMLGLTEEQIEELHLRDEWEDVCVPSGGTVVNPDPVGRRNGKGKW